MHDERYIIIEGLRSKRAVKRFQAEIEIVLKKSRTLS